VAYWILRNARHHRRCGTDTKIPGLGNLEIANINLGQTGTLDLGKLSANLEMGISSSISNIANSQLNTIIGRSGTLTNAAGVVGDLSKLNDQTGGLLGKVGTDILFGKELRDLEDGGVFRAGGILTGSDRQGEKLHGRTADIGELCNQRVFKLWHTAINENCISWNGYRISVQEFLLRC
jgi:hypothetical protein